MSFLLESILADGVQGVGAPLSHPIEVEVVAEYHAVVLSPSWLRLAAVEERGQDGRGSREPEPGVLHG